MPLFVYDAVIHAVKRGVYIFVACAVGQIQPHRHVGFLKESIRVDPFPSVSTVNTVPSGAVCSRAYSSSGASAISYISIPLESVVYGEL